MTNRFCSARSLIAFAALAVALVPTGAAGERLGMLDGLQSGSWELRPREQGAAAQRICLANGRSLIQLRHQTATCQRLIVAETASEVTVQYTCPGRGYGRTRIRRETAQLVQIDTQGIAEGLPFEFSVEARRVGPCGG